MKDNGISAFELLLLNVWLITMILSAGNKKHKND
jgi:hypothetical protein